MRVKEPPQVYDFSVSAEAGIRIRIRYPFDDLPPDETWLAAVVSRHNGELSGFVMQSFPQQRDAWFPASSDANAFVEELTSSGRWLAG